MLNFLKFLRRKQLTINDDSKQALFEARAAAFYDQSNALIVRLGNGELSIAEWEAEMRQIIKQMGTGSAAIGRGGWSSMESADWLRVARWARRQYGYLGGWAEELVQAAQTGVELSEGALAARARMYGNAGRDIFSQMQLISGGVDPDDLPYMPGDGTTECRSNCGCRWHIVTIDAANGDYDAFWLLGKVNNCETCIQRAVDYAPYRIRGGEAVAA